MSKLVLRFTFQRLTAKLLLTYVNEKFVSIIADPDRGVFILNPKKPAGEHVLAHAANFAASS